MNDADNKKLLKKVFVRVQSAVRLQLNPRTEKQITFDEVLRAFKSVKMSGI